MAKKAQRENMANSAVEEQEVPEDAPHRIENAVIDEIGLEYVGHHNSASLNVVIAGRGWGKTLDIPLNKVAKFMSLFAHNGQIGDRLEDGIYVHELKGMPVRVMFKDDSIFSDIVGIGDILASEEEDEFLMLRQA